jgi:hypothetical protein
MSMRLSCVGLLVALLSGPGCCWCRGHHHCCFRPAPAVIIAPAPVVR